MKSLSSVCLSVTKFSQDWIISFFWSCTWSQLTMISIDWRNQILEKKKKKWRPDLVPKIRCFAIFLSLSYISLEIAYNDSLRQHLTPSRGKTHRKNFLVPKFGPVGPEIRFFAIFSSLVHWFSFKCYKIIAWNNVYLLVL